VEKGFRENVLDGFGARWAVTESTGLMDARVGCFVGPHLPRRYNIALGIFEYLWVGTLGSTVLAALTAVQPWRALPTAAQTTTDMCL
jgi:hypothetical protein